MPFKSARLRPTPSGRVQAGLRGHVFEAVVAEIPVENRVFIALRMEVPGEGIGQSDILPLRALLVPAVLAHVAHQKTELAIVVVVEENGTGRMADEIKAGCFGDVREAPVPIVLE